MTELEQAYLQGFLYKCAEHNISEEQLLKEANPITKLLKNYYNSLTGKTLARADEVMRKHQGNVLAGNSDLDRTIKLLNLQNKARNNMLNTRLGTAGAATLGGLGLFLNNAKQEGLKPRLKEEYAWMLE
jgi:hypothetical protein